MANRTKPEKTAITTRAARKMKAVVKMHSKRPLPVSDLKFRVDRAIAIKARKKMPVADIHERPEVHSTSKNSAPLDHFLQRGRKGRSRYITALIFDGTRFIRAIMGLAPVILSDGNPAMKLRGKCFPLQATSEYVFMDQKSPSALAAVSTIALQLQNLFVPFSNTGYPTLKELMTLSLDESSRAALNGLAKKSAVRKSDARGKGTRGPSKSQMSENVTVVIRGLPTKSTSELRQIWLNAVRMMQRTQSHNLIHLNRLMENIESEWQRRAATASPGDEEYFKWPTTEAPAAKQSMGAIDVPGQGMLSYLEYHVGRTNGQATKVRQTLLDRVFAGKLPPVFDRAYMMQWSEPGSARRLEKMAETLSAFARNFKRRDDDRMDQAIREWEADLNYIFEKYYVGKFRFSWPSTKTS
mgnify:CR=1 FL=1